MASSLDTAPRTKDWYVELLMGFTILVDKIVTESKRIKLPGAVHILWTKSSGAQLQVPVEIDNPEANGVFAHAIGSSLIGPEPGSAWRGMKHWRQNVMRNTILARHPSKAPDFTEAWQAAMNQTHRNFGLCAEATPYLA